MQNINILTVFLDIYGYLFWEREGKENSWAQMVRKGINPIPTGHHVACVDGYFIV